MKTKQIIDTLQEYNDWRRDKISTTDYFDTITAHEIGLTIDAAIERLQTLEQERKEASLDFRKHIVELEHDQKYWKQEASRYKDRVTHIEILIEQMKYERDEARHIASYWRNMAGNFAISKRDHEFPWEEGSE